MSLTLIIRINIHILLIFQQKIIIKKKKERKAYAYIMCVLFKENKIKIKCPNNKFIGAKSKLFKNEARISSIMGAVNNSILKNYHKCLKI